MILLHGFCLFNFTVCNQKTKLSFVDFNIIYSTTDNYASRRLWNLLISGVDFQLGAKLHQYILIKIRIFISDILLYRTKIIVKKESAKRYFWLIMTIFALLRMLTYRVTIFNYISLHFITTVVQYKQLYNNYLKPIIKRWTNKYDM